MKVSLRQFRCHDSLDVEFPPGSLVLLRGETGAGKSTILQAIAWALYGRALVSKVDPVAKKNARTSVEISTPSYNIYRQKNPGLLRVTLKKECDILHEKDSPSVLENESAQAEIVRIFGPEDLWLASSYIAQDCRNSFMTASNADRMDLLYKLTFSDENPNDYLEKLEQEYIKAKASFESGCKELGVAVAAFSQASEGVDFQASLGPEELNTLRARSASLQKELLLLRQRQESRLRGAGALRQAAQNLEVTVQRLTSLSLPPKPDPSVPDPAEHLLRLKEGLAQVKRLAEVKQKNELLRQRVSTLKRSNIFSDSTEVGKNTLPLKQNNVFCADDLSAKNTLEQKEKEGLDTRSTLCTTPEDFAKDLQLSLGQALAQEKARAQGLARASQLKIIYQREAISAEKNRLESLLAAQPRLKFRALTAEVQQLRESLARSGQEEEEKSGELAGLAERAENLRQEAAEAEMALRSAEEAASLAARLLRCPLCQGDLQWKENRLLEAGGELGGAEGQPGEISERVQQLKIKLAEAKRAGEKAASELKLARERGAEREKKRQRQELEVENKTKELQTFFQSDVFLAKVEGGKNSAPFLEQSEETSYSEESTSLAEILSSSAETVARQRLAALENLEVVDPPARSSQALRVLLEISQGEKDLAQGREKETLLLASLPEKWRCASPGYLASRAEAWEKYLSQVSRYEGQKQELSSSAQRLREEIARLQETLPADASLEIEEAERELSQAAERERKGQEIARLLGDYSRLQERREALSEEAQELEALTLYRERAVQVACAAVQTTVSSVNSSMGDILESIFDKDIRVSLQLSREVKSTGRIKHEVNFAVAYQGGEFDALARLSGGEGDRASLALCVSLNLLSGCPFLMFDETTRSLNGEMQARVLKSLRESARGKIVICVVHEAVEGMFDHVIDMDKM